jgi:hypothetical protein
MFAENRDTQCIFQGRAVHGGMVQVSLLQGDDFASGWNHRDLPVGWHRTRWNRCSNSETEELKRRRTALHETQPTAPLHEAERSFVAILVIIVYDSEQTRQ